MTPQFQPPTRPATPATAPPPHPLCPLTSAEIAAASAILATYWPQGTDLNFKTITLQEPPKSKLVPYLEAEHKQLPLPVLARKVFVNYYIRYTSRFHEYTVDLTTAAVERHVLHCAYTHSHLDNEEIILVKEKTLAYPSVKAEIAKLELPKEGAIVADPWPYGSDGVNSGERMFQVYLYMRDPSNLHTYKVTRIDVLPTGKDFALKPLGL